MTKQSGNGTPLTPAGSDSVFAAAMFRWADWMSHAALAVAVLLILSSAVILRFTIDNLGISTDTSDMLSAELDFRQSYSNYQQSFPQTTDAMIVIVAGDSPDLARIASTRLADRLRDAEKLFKSVYQPASGEFFARQAFLYLHTDELQHLTDNLLRVQAFLGKLAREPSLGNLISLTQMALERIEAGESLDIEPFLREIDSALLARAEGRFYQVSWQRLLQVSDPGSANDLQLIILQPRLDYSRLQPAAAAMQAVRRAASQLQLDAAHGVSVQITGEVALAHEELQSASRGAAIAAILSFVFVAVVLSIGLGSWQLVCATIVTLFCGLCVTAGFATMVIGHLNLISIAFAVLYIGLGVDYAIHLCLRYRELMQQGMQHAQSLRGALRDVGGSLFICTATTAIGFYAFVPTSFTGVSELGLIAGTGMVISLVFSLTLLPALLSLFPRLRVRTMPQEQRRTSRLLRISARHPRAVLWLAFGATIAALPMLHSLRFDANPIDLRDPESESVRAFNELLQSSNASPWNLHILASNSAEALHWAEKIRQLPVVDDAVTLQSFVPSNQEDKLAIIDDLSLLLGPLTPSIQRRGDAAAKTRLATLQQLAIALGNFEGHDGRLLDTTKSLRRHLFQFLSGLSSEPSAAKQQQLNELEESLLGSLPALLDNLRTALKATAIGLENLPADLVKRWVSGDGGYRIDVLPAGALLNDQDLNTFVTQVRSVAANSTGAAVFNIESGRVVAAAFAQALLSALAAIAILLLILLPRKRDVIIVMLPLLLAAILTASGAISLGIGFNFANVIALPLLLGSGVDSAVHMVHRYRAALPADGELLGSSTIRAIVVSTLTTICSFGNLAFSPHPGAASMGQLLAMGTGITLLCMLTLLPALLYRRRPLSTISR